MTPYERVRKSRELTAATFPLPSVLDCVRYAITELAEYDDALLRQERTGDKRNNDKAHDPRNELGQALYMLLSAYMQWDEAPNGMYFPLGADEQWIGRSLYFASLTELSYLANYVLSTVDIETPSHERMKMSDVLGKADDVYDSMYALAMFTGWNVDALIDDTCAAFEAKHAPREER